MDDNVDKQNRLVSNVIASHILQSQQHHGILPMSIDSEEQIRKTYLNIIEKVDWKEELIKIGKMIKQDYLTQSGLEDIPYENINIDIVSKDGVIHNITKDINTIGRANGCDINTTVTYSDVSRLHAITFIINNMIILVDIGSCYGMEMVFRENTDEPLMVSKPNNRCVIFFNINEKVMVKLGNSYTISFSPKLCVVCLSNPRSIVLKPCNHMVLCQGCYDIIKQGDKLCPLCRQFITNGTPCYRLDTYA